MKTLNFKLLFISLIVVFFPYYNSLFARELASIPSISKSHPKWAWNQKAYGVTRHLEKDWLLHVGTEIDIDYYINPMFILRGTFATYKDSGNLWAGFFHFGPRIEAQKFKNIFIRVGFGPTLIFRQNWWLHKPAYTGNAFYGKTRHDKEFESAFLLYGGDVEVEWKVSQKYSVVYALIPGYPVIFANNIGIRSYW